MIDLAAGTAWLPASRNSDPASSHLAETEITTSGRRKNQCDQILKMVRTHDGETARELASHDHDLDRYAYSRRLPDLESHGLVTRGEMRKCRVGGRLSVTWGFQPVQKSLF